MTITSVMLSILWIVIIPLFIGTMFFSIRKKEFISSWFYGQLLLWSFFQIIAVRNILRVNDFNILVRNMKIITLVLCLVSLIINIAKMAFKTNKSNESSNSNNAKESHDINNFEISNKKFFDVGWIIFSILLGIMLFLIVFLAYSDGDDSYYVSEAVSINSSNRMYRTIPYTGASTEMDYRHSLEPFPAWVAFVARVSGMNVTSLSHVILPFIFLPLTLAVFALTGKALLGNNKRYLPYFMIFTELLFMFGYYSEKTPEKFLLTRIRQGKATLATLIIPGIIYCLFLILKSAQEKKKIDFRVWLLLLILNVSACLCSTLGTLICVIPIVLVAIIMVPVYKKGWHLIPMAIACMPCIYYALLYLGRTLG